jgi:hypothetical protein
MEAKGCRKIVDVELVFPFRVQVRWRQIGSGWMFSAPKLLNTAKNAQGCEDCNVKTTLQVEEYGK